MFIVRHTALHNYTVVMLQLHNCNLQVFTESICTSNAWLGTAKNNPN